MLGREDRVTICVPPPGRPTRIKAGSGDPGALEEVPGQTDQEHPFLKDWKTPESRSGARRWCWQRPPRRRKCRRRESHSTGLESEPRSTLRAPTWCRWSATSSYCGATCSATRAFFTTPTSTSTASCRRYSKSGWTRCGRELDALEKALPPQYPFLQVIRDKEHPVNEHVHLRGNADNLGDEVPRHFLTHLVEEQPARIHARERTARTGGRHRQPRQSADCPSDRKSRLAASFRPGPGPHAEQLRTTRRPAQSSRTARLPRVEPGQEPLVFKALHREILLSSTYQMSTEFSEADFAKDPENRLLVARQPPQAGHRSAAR